MTRRPIELKDHGSEALPMNKAAAPAKFSWTDGGKSGIEVSDIAAALPQAIWVSSVTENGLDELRQAVLHMLQSQADDWTIS